MLGAVIGDIVGSIYEWDRIKTKDFIFFSDRCFFTDDTVCTMAVADILLQSRSPARRDDAGVVSSLSGTRLRWNVWRLDLF